MRYLFVPLSCWLWVVHYLWSLYNSIWSQSRIFSVMKDIALLVFCVSKPCRIPADKRLGVCDLAADYFM